MKRFFSAVRDLTSPAEQSDRPFLNKRTQTLSIWEGSLWAVLWGFGESYLAPFALFLMADNLTMAFIGTGPVLIAALAQIAGAALLDRVGRRKPIVLIGFAIQAASYLPLFILPLLLPAIKIPALLVTVFICFFFTGMPIPSWMSLMGDAVDATDRGRYFAHRARIIMYSMVSANLLAGIIINQWKAAGYTVAGFGFLFGIASLARFISIPFMKQHYDAPLQRQEKKPAFSLRTHLPDSNFVKFTLTIALMSGAISIAGPFIAVYTLRDLQWSYLQFTLNMVVFMMAQTFFVRWWGSLCDRHGNRSVLMATCCLMPLLPLFWVFTRSYPVLLFGQIVSGATWSGFNLAASNFIYDSVGQENRARVFSFYSVVNGLFSLAGGMLIGAPLAKYAPDSFSLGSLHIHFLSSLPVVFTISGVTRAVIAAIMLPQFKEVRKTEPISTARILWLLGTGQPLFGQAGEFVRAVFTRRKASR